MKIENLCINCMKEKANPDGICEHCGFDSHNASVPQHHLAPFVILAGKYLVGNAIGEGGFGITYIGMDLNLEMRVAIKEYYPNGCAIRDTSGNSSTVYSYSGEQQSFFEMGREKFINEAKVLARCINLPEIVTVKDFFKENHTAYIVMEYIDGKTLKSYLREQGGRISVSDTLRMMKPVIKSLGEVHKMNLIHRDISPDNIMIKQDGSMKVLDFGGARDFAAANGKSMSIMLKPGYAPEEQYRTHGEQGPWTDVYALCATMYRCITGAIPPEAMERTYKDDLKPLSDFQIECPLNVQYAIQKGLSIYKGGRFTSMEELYEALYEKEDSGNSGYRQGTEPISQHRQNVYAEEDNVSLVTALKVLIGVLGVILLVLLVVIVMRFGDFGAATEDGAKASEPDAVVTQEAVTEATKEEKKADKKKDSSEKKAKADPTPSPTPEPVKVSSIDRIDMGQLTSKLNGRGSNAFESFYVYDMQAKDGKGVDYESPYPASALITIPILYTAAKKIDNGTLALDTAVPFEYTYQGGRGTLTASQNGQAVKVDDVLQNMLLYSDNNAINTMINVLTLEDINNTCQSAGFTSVDMQRKIISTPSDLNNYISAGDMAMMVSSLYNNTFNVINRDYILNYMKIVDKAGRLGIFQSDELYNNGNYCSQNGIIPDQTSGHYTEVGIIFADGKEYIICGMADGGNADVAAAEFSDAAVYVHSCMKEG